MAFDKGTIHTWSHPRAGRVNGQVVASTDKWVTVLCLEDNNQAFAGNTINLEIALLEEED